MSDKPDKCPYCRAAILHDGDAAVYECVSTWVEGRVNVRGTQCLDRENAMLRAAWNELRTFCQQGTLRSYSYGKVIAYMDTLLTQEPRDGQ